MREMWRQNPVCAIFRNVPMDIVLEYAEAVRKGGIRMLEIATNTNSAYEQIEILRREFKEELLVGAGTVVTKERCQNAYDAGAQFFLTPSVCIDTFAYCEEKKIPLLPGVMTPSDVDICQQYGYSVMKLFPAGNLPDGYIKSLKGPYDNTDYVAVGGVNLDNLPHLLEQGYLGAGIGSDLTPKEYIKNKEWDKVTRYISERMKVLKK